MQEFEKILVLGDSLCRQLPVVGKNIHIESIPGFTTEDFLKMDAVSIENLLEEDNYGTVVLCMGINDLENSFSVEETMTNLKKVIDKCHSHNVVLVHLPAEYQDFNEALKTFGHSCCDFFLHVTAADLQDSCYHLNENGRKKFLDAILRTIFLSHSCP